MPFTLSTYAIYYYYYYYYTFIGNCGRQAHQRSKGMRWSQLAPHLLGSAGQSLPFRQSLVTCTAASSNHTQDCCHLRDAAPSSMSSQALANMARCWSALVLTPGRDNTGYTTFSLCPLRACARAHSGRACHVLTTAESQLCWACSMACRWSASTYSFGTNGTS